MRSKPILHCFLWSIAIVVIFSRDLKGQNNETSMEILIEYPDSRWKKSVLIIDNGSFKHDLLDFYPDENGRAYIKFLLDKPSFASLEMYGASYSATLFLWPGDLLHIKFTNSPETETISHADFQGQTKNIQRYLNDNQNYGVRLRYIDLLDPLYPVKAEQDSISFNVWKVEQYTATKPEQYFLEMFNANMFGLKWLYSQSRGTNSLVSKDTISLPFPEEVITKTRELYKQYPQLNSISRLATKMGFGNFEAFHIEEMTNCTELRKSLDYSQTFQVKARLESNSRGVSPRKMTAKEVDFIRDCLFLLRDTEDYEEVLESTFNTIYAGLPDASVKLDLDKIEPDATILTTSAGNDSLVVLVLYDYHTEDSIFQIPEWLDDYPLSMVAVSLDYSTEKWEEGKSKVPPNIPAIHLKGGITHPAAKAYQWYQFPRLVLYNSKSQMVLEHIMPQYERKDLWEEILSGMR